MEFIGTGAEERKRLVSWLQQQEVTEVVMQSTAQYWKPIWLELEPHFQKLHLAQAQSNRAPRGRKNDFRDAKWLARRLLAGELSLSYAPEPEQRLWRVMTRTKQQLVRERAAIQNRIEALLEEMQIKLASVIGDLLGVSVLKLYWEHVELMDRQIADLDRLVAQALKPYREAVPALGRGEWLWCGLGAATDC